MLNHSSKFYDPKLFPSLVYKMKHPKVVLLDFISRKIVLISAKNWEQIYEAFENI